MKKKLKVSVYLTICIYNFKAENLLVERTFRHKNKVKDPIRYGFYI